MSYALVHYPEINTEAIDLLRRKYDPQADLIGPHITLIFPLPQSVGEPLLVSHIEQVLREWSPFSIRLQELEESCDDYLFLTPTDGTEALVRLHEDLYTGMLVEYKRADLPYVPHITLGAFTREPARLAQALEEARELQLDSTSVVNRLDLVKVNAERTAVVWNKQVLFGGCSRSEPPNKLQRTPR